MGEQKLKVWWIPQIGMGTRFDVPVSSVEEGAKVMDVLADYDAFQFENHVKPDYCNAGGLMQLDEDGEWTDWYDEETGEDDPRAYVEAQQAKP